jgi:hypothetical protein
VTHLLLRQTPPLLYLPTHQLQLLLLLQVLRVDHLPAQALLRQGSISPAAHPLAVAAAAVGLCSCPQALCQPRRHLLHHTQTLHCGPAEDVLLLLSLPQVLQLLPLYQLLVLLPLAMPVQLMICC